MGRSSSLYNFFRLENIAVLTVLSTLFDSGISYGKFYIFHLFSIILLLKLLSDRKELLRVTHFFTENKTFLFPIIFLFISLISLFWSDSLHEGFKKSLMTSFGIPTFIAFAVVIYKERWDSLLSGAKWIIAAHLVLALAETATSLRWPISIFSPLAELFGRIPQIEADTFSQIRPTSFFWNVNDSALFTLLCFPFLFLLSRKYLSYFLTILVSWIIFRHSSRGILLLFIVLNISLVMIGVLSLFLPKLLKYPRKWIVPSLFALSVILISVNTTDSPHLKLRSFDSVKIFKKVQTKIKKGPNKYQDHTEAASGGVQGVKPPHNVDNSVDKRVLLTKKALRHYSKSPLHGLGVGTLSTLKVDYMYGELTLNAIHNYWVEVLTELGGVFFSIYIIWLIYIFRNLLKEPTYRALPFAAFLSLLLFLPGVIVLPSAFYFLPKWFLYGLCCSIITFSEGKQDN